MCGKTSKSVRISHKKRKAPPSTKQERSGKYAHSHIDKHVPRTHDVADRTILGPTQEGNRTLVDTSQSSSSSGQVAIRKRKIVDEEGEKEKEKEKGNPRIDVPEPTIKPKTQPTYSDVTKEGDKGGKRAQKAALKKAENPPKVGREEQKAFRKEGRKKGSKGKGKSSENISCW